MLKFHEQAGSVVFTFGRFNPPTTGHEKLLNKVKMVAGSSRYVIYPSQSQNPKKDPLPFALKVAYMRKMFPKHAKNILADKKIINVFDIAVKLYNEKYTDIGMVVGSDRVKEFRSLLDKYNGVTGKKHGYYKFRTISVISAGERDPDAEGVSGMSASKMRAAAYKGDLESFKLGVPKGFKEVEKLYKDVRKYMGLREQRDMGLMTDYEELRDAYLTGKVWNIDDLIEARGITGKIIRRGTNYIAFVDESNKVHKAWLHEITIDERPNWIARSQYAVDRITHPKEYEAIVKKYIDGLEKGYGKHTVKKEPGELEVRTKQSLIHDIVRRYGRKTLSTRSLIQYINKLVSKGKLPQEAGLKEVKSEASSNVTTLGLAISKKKRKGHEVLGTGGAFASGESVKEWFESNETRAKYQIQYEDNWWWKLNETHDIMLEKLGICCEDYLTEQPEQVSFKQFQLQNAWGEITEKDNEGKELNNPTRGDTKKYKVYVKNDKGNVVKVEFGDPNMSIKRDDPERRKSFRARHNCENPGPKWKARYWSCKFWSTKSVTDLMKG